MLGSVITTWNNTTKWKQLIMFVSGLFVSYCIGGLLVSTPYNYSLYIALIIYNIIILVFSPKFTKKIAIVSLFIFTNSMCLMKIEHRDDILSYLRRENKKIKELYLEDYNRILKEETKKYENALKYIMKNMNTTREEAIKQIEINGSLQNKPTKLKKD